MSNFQRPAELAFPLVYHTFRAKDKESDETVEYRIQDIPESDFERAIALMARDYSPEESFSRCRGVVNEPDAFAEIQGIWRTLLGEKLSIACYKEGSDDIVGVNILAVGVKDVNSMKGTAKTAAVKDVFRLFKFIDSHHNVYEHHGVDKFLFDYGLVTNRHYRHRGVATEFLKARVPILKAFNLKVTSTVFTVTGSQKAAVKASYEKMFSVKWTDIQGQFPEFNFSIASSETCQTLDLKI